MEIKQVRVSELRPAAYNPRKKLRPGDVAYQEIKRSLETFGLVQPLVWNEATGNLIAGHQRLQVIRDEDPDVETLPCAVVRIDPAQEKALNLALNKINGEWDTGLLANVLEDLMSVPDLDLPTGFSEIEIDDLLARRAEVIADAPVAQQEGAGAPASGPSIDEYHQHDAEVSEGRGLGNPVIKYEIIFDDEQQQAEWYAFVRHLKKIYPNKGTLGNRLSAYLDEIDFADDDAIREED